MNCVKLISHYNPLHIEMFVDDFFVFLKVVSKLNNTILIIFLLTICSLCSVIYTTLFGEKICVLNANVVCRVVLVSRCAAGDCTRVVGSIVDGKSAVEDAVV